MLQKVLRQLLKFFDAFLHNTLGLILASLIGVPLFVSWVTGTLNFLIQTLKSPVPLWATISLVLLCGLYILLHIKKYYLKHSEKNPLRSLVDIISQNKENYQFRDNLLWFPDDSEPFCPVCYETNDKKIHLLFHQGEDAQEYWEYYDCHTCKYRTETKTTYIGEPL